MSTRTNQNQIHSSNHCIAIAGHLGSFHHEAAQAYFGCDVAVAEHGDFASTVASLKTGRCSNAILAIENTVAGSILANYRLIFDEDVKVLGEVFLPIELHLMGVKGATLHRATSVQSHPIALRQCADFLGRHPHLTVIEKNDTASCARDVSAQGDPSTLVVAGLACAKRYNLEILVPRIEKSPRNFTRFLILSKIDNPVSGANKATLSFSLRNLPGTLARFLQTIHAHEVNLCGIQSLPLLQEIDNYQFYADLEYRPETDTTRLFKALEDQANTFRILGKYQSNDQRNSTLPQNL
jgi:prephenate dehydratase